MQAFSRSHLRLSSLRISAQVGPAFWAFLWKPGRTAGGWVSGPDAKDSASVTGNLSTTLTFQADMRAINRRWAGNEERTKGETPYLPTGPRHQHQNFTNCSQKARAHQMAPTPSLTHPRLSRVALWVFHSGPAVGVTHVSAAPPHHAHSAAFSLGGPGSPPHPSLSGRDGCLAVLAHALARCQALHRGCNIVWAPRKPG